MDGIIQILSRIAVFDEKNTVCWIKKINNNDDVSSNFLEWSETQFSHEAVRLMQGYVTKVLNIDNNYSFNCIKWRFLLIFFSLFFHFSMKGKWREGGERLSSGLS